MRKVCLVGAGYISQVHAEALRVTSGTTISSVVDPNEGAARKLAEKFSIPNVYTSVEAAIAAGQVDCAHVLTPPDLHSQTALPLLESAIPVLLEKPLATSSAECRSLTEAAVQAGSALGVNQNFVYHPAFLKLRQALKAHRLGRPRFVNCLYNVPLRQMQAQQFGHWMFSRPGNILLEQAVHPLSQIVAIAGPFQEQLSMAGTPREISPGVPFYDQVSLIAKCRDLPVDLRLALGQTFPFWQIAVICDDGVLVADILNNRFFTFERTLWLEFFDAFLSGSRTAGGILRDSIRNAADYIFSTAKIKPRTDGFFQSVQASVAAFHGALDAGRMPELDGAFGAHLVSICEDIAARSFTAPVAPATPRNDGAYDVTVLGGTGFIGRHLVKRLLADGLRVGVVARNTRNLAPIYYDDRVTLVRGDIRKADDVERAIGDARIVINLAHGGGGNSYEEVRAAMVDSAETIARCCLAGKVERLIHIGSIAGLYLGPQEKPVTGDTPPDPEAGQRADYARAKAECDRMLWRLRDQEGLRVCILRPGLVIGEDGIALHSGLGFFNNEQYCVGWNKGNNPLPFVLVEDVADAIARACTAPAAIGHAYNLVGDVRLSAREYMQALGVALERPLRFHPNSTTALWLMEVAKWTVKRASGRKVPIPSRRDLLSRALEAQFDCADVKADLGWAPVADRQTFMERGIKVHVTP